ncbi:MAG: hypothetical protein KF746_00830 [Chitinophagaceae bacterium]|nr:hypothetical protein [Chitinophagaceae bacterium]
MKISGLSNPKHDLNIFYLEDSIPLQPKEVLSQFHEGKLIKLANSGILNKGITPYYYWFVFEIKNDLADNTTIMWEFSNPAINMMEVFKTDGDTLRSLGLTGDHFPFRQRPYHFHLFTYPVKLTPGETSVLLAFVDKRNENFFVEQRLFLMSDFVSHTSYLYLAFGVCFGILLAVFFFNLFIFSISFDKIHFWYSIYLVLTLLQLMTSEGLDFQFLYPNIPALSDVSRFWSGSFVLLLLIVVMELFYKQFPLNVLFKRMLTAVKAGCVLLPLLSLPVYHYYPYVTLKQYFLLVFGLNIIAGISLVTIISLQRAWAGFRPAWFYIGATFMLFAGTILYLSNMYGFINMSKTVPNVLQAGMIVEAVVISFGILYRYYLFRKENADLLLVIEKERVGHTEAVIKMQQREQKRIAEDLHDELGSSLATLKLKLQNSELQGNELKEIVDIVDRASANTRNIAHNLMPPEFEGTDLQTLLSGYYRRLNMETAITFHFHSSGEEHYFNKDEELMLYRIVMELTNNILKHSGGREATIQLVYYDDHLELMAEDDGHGMAEHGNMGIGMKNIKSRVDYLNGVMRIDTSPRGTTIIISIVYRTF